jgi:hypothetical protein
MVRERERERERRQTLVESPFETAKWSPPNRSKRDERTELKRKAKINVKRDRTQRKRKKEEEAIEMPLTMFVRIDHKDKTSERTKPTMMKRKRKRDGGHTVDKKGRSV